MFISLHQSVGQDAYTRTSNSAFKNVSEFNYVGTTIIKKCILC